MQNKGIQPSSHNTSLFLEINVNRRVGKISCTDSIAEDRPALGFETVDGASPWMNNVDQV